jgi:hypothetical protein
VVQNIIFSSNLLGQGIPIQLLRFTDLV